MKNQLPNTIEDNKGFTLIELLIAITIVAILSVLGFSIFANIQKGARDSIRRIEVDSIAKNLEAAYDPASRSYTYSFDQYNADFTTTRPRDPQLIAAYSAQYCVYHVAIVPAVIPVDPTWAGWNSTTAANPAGCPTVPVAFDQFSSKFVAQPATNVMARGSNNATTTLAGTLAVTGGNSQIQADQYWKICAKLEATQNVYCKESLQR